MTDLLEAVEASSAVSPVSQPFLIVITTTFFSAQEARDAYYMKKNYPDWFATVGKTMVKKSTGGFVLVSDNELDELKKSNRLTYETPKAMGGRTVDFTQKPIWVLKE